MGMVMSVPVWRACAIISTTFVFLLAPFRAHAYVDPNLGGQLFQAVYLIAIGVAGFIVTPFLLFGRAIVRSMRRLLRRFRKTNDRPGHS